MLSAAILLLALSRAEIVQRMRAPVVTQVDGFVQVFADCPEDMRRDYQMPVASFTADLVRMLYRGVSEKPRRFPSPALIVHLGDVRTNTTELVTKVTTNDSRVVSRLYLRAPGFADVARYRLEVVKAFYRAVKGQELTDGQAAEAYRSADPRFRISDRRRKLAEWLNGKGGHDDEEMLKLMRMVIEPGVATRSDVLVFASRLFLYPQNYDIPFQGGFRSLSFKDAVKLARADPLVRLAAYYKVGNLLPYGGGRSEEMRQAAESYTQFLLELAKQEKSDDELLGLLEKADAELCVALEKAR